jgi:hypothetical protein
MLIWLIQIASWGSLVSLPRIELPSRAYLYFYHCPCMPSSFSKILSLSPGGLGRVVGSKPINNSTGITVTLQGKPLATTLDKVFPPFGTCLVKNNTPCVPALLRWEGYYERLTLLAPGCYPLLEKSTIKCAIGGTVSILSTLQLAVPMPPVAPASGKRAHDEHGPVSPARRRSRPVVTVLASLYLANPPWPRSFLAYSTVPPPAWTRPWWGRNPTLPKIYPRLTSRPPFSLMAR